MEYKEINSSGTLKVFENPYLETLTKSHWSVPIIFWLPIICVLTYFGYNHLNISYFKVIIFYFIGIFAWSLTEYTLHRFLFHLELKSKWGQKLHYYLHGIHHIYPNDRLRLVLPPIMSLVLSIPVFLIVWLFCPSLYHAFIIFSGLIVGYLIYDESHYALHHANITTGFWGKLKKHHMIHHFKDHDNGFGVSFLGLFWDYVFGTNYKNLI